MLHYATCYVCACKQTLVIDCLPCLPLVASQELQLSRQTSFAPSAATAYQASGIAAPMQWLARALSLQPAQQEAHSECSELSLATTNCAVGTEARTASTTSTGVAAAPAPASAHQPSCPPHAHPKQGPAPSISYTAPVVTAEAAAAIAAGQWPPAEWSQPAEGSGHPAEAASPWPLLQRSLDLQGADRRPQSGHQRLRGQGAVDVQVVQVQAHAQAQVNALLQQLGAAHKELADVG